MPHQSSQLTEDTEVEGEKRKGRDSEGKLGDRDVWSDTDSKKRGQGNKGHNRRERAEACQREKAVQHEVKVQDFRFKGVRGNEKSFRRTVPEYLAIISFSLLEEWPPLPRTLAGVERK